MKVNRYELLGTGKKRDVYDLGNGFVLKAAKSREGIQSNRTEWRIFRAPRFASVRPHLAAVIRYRRRWLIMRKHTRPFPMTPPYIRKYRRLRAKFRKLGIWPRDMYSMTHKAPSLTNLRVDRKGRVVVIDYGNFIIRKK